MNPARIPLFPLDIVLFPGQAVPLHIFEPRYRQMTRHCIDTQSPFGIVFSHDGNMAQIGCSAMIVKILKEYEDGRSDILTAGKTHSDWFTPTRKSPIWKRTLNISRRISRKSIPPFPRDSNSFATSVTRFSTERTRQQFETEGGISLAYHVASELPVEAVIRQSLLEIRSEAVRQVRLVAHLAEWYPQLQKREHVRGKAAGNGHGKL